MPHSDELRYRAFRWIAVAAENHPLLDDLPEPEQTLDGVVTAELFDRACDDVIDYLTSNGVKL